MKEKYHVAGKALKLMFMGGVIGLVATVMDLIPALSSLSGIVTLVGGVMALIGLCQAGAAHKLYSRAVLMLILSVVCTLVSGGVLAGGVISGSMAIVWLGAVLLVGVTVFSLLQLYCVCGATSSLLREVGNEAVAAKGDAAWKINAVCYVVVIVGSVLVLLAPSMGGVMVSTLIGIVSIVGSVVYVLFLKEGHQVLSASGAEQL